MCILLSDATYQSCPCPMQSCPKNVHTGPLTGDGKRSNMTAIAKESMPLPPVALALPLEPASVAGPPSPARGSAGMPPPPSPAGATYQPAPTTPAPQHTWDGTKQENTDTSIDCKTTEKRRKARVGKNMVRNNIASNFVNQQNTMLLMCHNPPQPTEMADVKREVESPEELIVPQILKNERIPEINTKCETQVTETKNEPEVQTSLEDNSRLEEASQRLEGEDHKDQAIPADSTPARRKSMEEPQAVPEPTHATEQCIEEQTPQTTAEDRLCAKRKLSVDENIKTECDEELTVKKPKLSLIKPKSSYKDLIKKATKTNKIKLTNGKRKLNDDLEIKTPIFKTPKIMLGAKSKKSKQVKRKQNQLCKDEPPTKKQKTSKPLAASNLHNSKQNTKPNKKNSITQQAENTEPLKRINQKKTPVNSKTKKLAPQVLDSLFTKNNVDRTIESVILNSSALYDEIRTSVKTENKISVKQEKACVKTEKPCVKSENKTCAKIENKNIKTEKATVEGPTEILSKQVTKPISKIIKTGCGRAGISRRKNKNNNNIISALALAVPKVPRRSIHAPKWSNGWSWEGDPYKGKVFLNVSFLTI